MSDARIQEYAQALFEVARVEGTLDAVEDELWDFARSYDYHAELRNRLTDDWVPAEKHQAIIEELLADKVTSTTTKLVSMVVRSGRGRDLSAIVDQLIHRASAAKELEVAHVRTAVALTDDQRASLKTALENATGCRINLKAVVDPAVVGGIVATVGDKVFDDSIRTRIDQLKSLL